MTTHNDLINPLLTDFYQITMAKAYFDSGKHLESAVFEVLFRKNPFKGEYTIFAGLNEIAYLKTQLPNDTNPEFFNYLQGLTTQNVKIITMKEGQIVFPKEPLLTLEGPLALIQLLETPILNLVNFSSLIATNASRMKTEARGKNCFEFGTRRAQGPDGAFSASQYSYLGGFEGTSNVLAGFKLNIPIFGTMAHSYVTSFSSLDQVEEKVLNGVEVKARSLKYREELQLSHTNEGELTAFISFSQSFPNNFLCLIDTYDTVNSGLPNYLIVACALIDAGFRPKGIRLDSGDLATLSQKCKLQFKNFAEKLNKPDLLQLIVVASNDINEKSLKELAEKKHEIDSFGIGTNLVTCQAQPALGLVYKLVEIETLPKHKLSAEVEKSTLPGKKAVSRVWLEDSFAKLDLISQETEQICVGKTINAVDLSNFSHRYTFVAKKIERLNLLVFDGKTTGEEQSLEVSRSFCIKQKEELHKDVFLNEKALRHMILITEHYFHFYQACNEKILVRQKLN